MWTNGGGDSFVNPYSKEVWDYNIEIAKEAAKLGFKEIQFDYVRFPEGFEKRADSLKYTKTDQSRVDVVSDFVQYAREELAPLGIRVSVDIFGYAASVPAAEGIGQDFVKISKTSISSVRWYTQAITRQAGSALLYRTRLLTRPSRDPWKIPTRSSRSWESRSRSSGHGFRTLPRAGSEAVIMPSTAKGNRRADSRPQRYKRR